jgi:hypothetical protein
VIAVGALSKAYGLAGLRIGWCVAPRGHADALWARKEYTTIAPTALSDALATVALQPDVRPRILERTRGIVRDNWRTLETWLATRSGELRCRAPDAGVITFVHYSGSARSTDVAERLRERYGVLMVPGEHFGAEGFLRFCFGHGADELSRALELVGRALSEGILLG